MKNSRKLLGKEIKLAASPLSWLFTAFALMTLIPGYPILVGSFFVCLGLFQSFQSSRENNDILYTVLLPVSKTDAVKAKYRFVVLIQMIAFAISAVITLLRLTLMTKATPYVTNPMMNANQAFLAYMLVIFALFNWLFLCGFFKTAYKFGASFILFIVVSFIVVIIGEVLHHIPGLEFLNGTDTLCDKRMWIILAAGIVFYVLVTFVSCRVAMKRFERVDM
jgi:hypothetical protein